MLFRSQGESQIVTSVSVETGEVFVHIQPLLPTNLLRDVALKFNTVEQPAQNGQPASLSYEVLDLYNYQGPVRTFTRQQAAHVLNGFVLTVHDKNRWASLEHFHREHAQLRVRDYLVMGHRYVLFQRHDVEFEVVMTTDPVGVQTESIDGRTVPRPVFESNQMDVNALPFKIGRAHV